MRISYSAATTWRGCQQAFHYSYMDRLRPKLEAAPPVMGRVLHTYLEEYDSQRGETTDPDEASVFAQEMTTKKYAEELEGLAFASFAAGEDATGQELNGLLEKALRIAERYHDWYGRADWEAYDILACEVSLEYPLTADIVTPLVIDRITQDANGRVLLWEHKTGGNLPPAQRRLKDLQTVLYAAVAEELYGIKVDGVMWNYIRTKEPSIPQLLKSGELTRRQDLDTSTTWKTFLKAIEDNGLDAGDYEDVRERLEPMGERQFMQRNELPILQAESIVLRDFISTAQAIKFTYGTGLNVIPVRNISSGCDWCSFRKPCEAVILGYDESDIIDQLFTRKEVKQNGDEHASETAGTTLPGPTETSSALDSLTDS